MKIVNVCLTGPFTENMTYQENLLTNQMKNDGHEVIVIAGCYKYHNNKIIETPQEDTILPNKIRLIRRKDVNIFGQFFSRKIRAIKGLQQLLQKINPDIIFHHGVQTYEMLTIAKYKKSNPNIKFYVDSHSDFHNSANNFLSKNILHKIFYKSVIRKALPYVDKVFYISYESMEFLKEMYNIPSKIMEYYPLGGIVLEDSARLEKRKRIREELEFNNNDILIIHSGKMNRQKRTIELIKAFNNVKDCNLHLILIGSLDDDINDSVMELISLDDRIKFLGWKNGNELLDYLCASDLYLQPGTQSATMQNAACTNNALALYPYPSHKYLFKDSVFYIETSKDIENLLINVLTRPDLLEEKRKSVFNIAKEKLDYKVLASRLYNWANIE